MESLLFLAHRLPYPPNKGDKIRSYHILRHLCSRYRVHVGTFVDDPDDMQHCPALRSLGHELHVETIHPRLQRMKSAVGFVQGQALTLPYYRNAGLRHWVEQTVARERITRAYVFSSPMAQYLAGFPGMRAVMDFVDMDSIKWTQYAEQRGGVVGQVYRREGRRLLAFEKTVTASADAVLFVTEDEARLFRQHCPAFAARIHAVRNGVDGDYFAPDPARSSPYPDGESPVLFTGAMDYWPNVDAVRWFASEVLPALRERDPAVRFYIAGMNPDPRVLDLGREPGIVVTGRVGDIRPYVQHARVVVAPLRIARGVQNKVLEAMAMGRAVVATPAAATGLDFVPGTDLAVADEPAAFGAAVQALLDPGLAAAMGERARARILQQYTWPVAMARLDAIMTRGPGRSGIRPAVAKTQPAAAFRSP
ncbi:MAG: TIGR03087 family PEP-CTERM/XrtA system glycosyltransferase [Casimicrobiaceae bacterium]